MDADHAVPGGLARRCLTRSRLVMASVIVAAAAVAALLALSEPADSLNNEACDGDGPEGYECTELLNKGGGEVIGEQFVRPEDDEEMEIIVHLFDVPSTDLSEEKLCLDTEATPMENEVSCTGGNAAVKIQADEDLPDPEDVDDADDEWKVLVEGFDAVGTVTLDGEELARYRLPQSLYEFTSFHFNQGGYSVESFVAVPLLPDLSVAKAAAEDTIDPGQTASFAIEVSNAGPGTATDVVLHDDLPEPLSWTVDADTGECDISDGSSLVCELGDLPADESVSVTVSAEATADACGTHDNIASAEASNHDPVSDDASVEVRCGAIGVEKTAKHADDSGETEPDLEAGFTVTDSSGSEVDTVTTDADGNACVGGLALDTYTVEETDVPAGYAAPAEQTVDVDSVGTCDDTTQDLVFANEPLTDVTVSATPQVDGATETIVHCWEGTPSGEPDHTVTASDASLDVEDLAPTDPDVTVACEITVDP